MDYNYDFNCWNGFQLQLPISCWSYPTYDIFGEAMTEEKYRHSLESFKERRN